MPTASQLRFYFGASRAQDDVTAEGGAIDLTARLLDSQMSSAGNLEVVSDGADTRAFTYILRTSTGGILSGGAALNGATPVVIPGATVDRIIEFAVASADGSRTVTIRPQGGGAPFHTIHPTELVGAIPFHNAIAQAAGGSNEVYYAVLYRRNDDAAADLLTAVVRGVTDASGLHELALATAVGNVAALTNRRTAPAAGFSSFVEEGVDLAVPGTDLLASGHIAHCIRYTLPPDTAPGKSTYTVRIAGNVAA